MYPWYVSPFFAWVSAGNLGMLFAVNNNTEVDMSGYRFSAYVIRDREGWAAHCPEFPGCRARGATYEEALANIRDVISIFVEDGFGDDELPPQHEELSFTTLVM
jgi:predicted RNase H-like HicB family nuclease